MDLQAKIKNLIKEQDITVREFCRRIDMSNPNLYLIYKRNSIEINKLNKICEEFNVPITYFFDIKEGAGGPPMHSQKIDEEIKKNEQLIKELSSENAQLKEDKRMLTRYIYILEEMKNSIKESVTGSFQEMLLKLLYVGMDSDSDETRKIIREMDLTEDMVKGAVDIFKKDGFDEKMRELSQLMQKNDLALKNDKEI